MAMLEFFESLAERVRVPNFYVVVALREGKEGESYNDEAWLRATIQACRHLLMQLLQFLTQRSVWGLAVNHNVVL